MRTFLNKYFFPLIRWYWKIVRPKTFGVKAVIVRRDGPSTVLLVQHSYGNQLLWNLPGGGFNPKKEQPEQAIARELSEELLCVPSSLVEIGRYYTEAEGKRDTVTIYLVTVESLGTVQGSEVRLIQWHSIEEVKSMTNIARIARYGIDLYEKLLSGLK